MDKFYFLEENEFFKQKVSNREYTSYRYLGIDLETKLNMVAHIKVPKNHHFDFSYSYEVYQVKKNTAKTFVPDTLPTWFDDLVQMSSSLVTRRDRLRKVLSRSKLHV